MAERHSALLHRGARRVGGGYRCRAGIGAAGAQRARLSLAAAVLGLALAATLWWIVFGGR